MNLQSPDNESLDVQFGDIILTDEMFDAIRTLVYERIGVDLSDKKRSLLNARLQNVLRQRGFSSFQQYYVYVQNDTSGNGLLELVNRITTQHTTFFRGRQHFEFFSRVALKESVARCEKHHSKILRVWCAGCSTGEEAYSLAMVMLQYFGDEYKSWDAGLFATDVSEEALRVARRGIYASGLIQGIPRDLQRKCLLQQPDGDWRVEERVRKEITFRRFNLMNQVFPFRRPFDIIFCRNVMIYFDQKTREALLKRFYDSLTPGGYLFLGHSESLGRENNLYDYLVPAVYRKKME